ncbi:lamin tail domain-containing protein [bacterium]|nr:lamin tail domain-containing protein [bacterium]
MKKFIIILLIYIGFGCTSEPGDPVERSCSSKLDCPDTQDCRFVGLASEIGTCVDRTKCFIDGDCSDQRICASYSSNLSYCGYSSDKFQIVSEEILPNAYFRENFSFQLELEGVTAPYSFQLKNSTLPTGLTLSEAGLISGIPTEEIDNHSFTVIAINGASTSTYFYNYRGDEKTFTITTINDLCRGINCSSASNTSCIGGECICDDGFHKIPNDTTGGCESNIIENVNCTNTPPENATWDSELNPNGIFNQNWDELSQSYKPTPDSCVWSCNQNYHSFNGVCDLNEIQTTCTNTLPENATWDSSNSEGIVNQIWNSNSNQYEPSADSCIWSCNQNYHSFNGVCNLNEIQTACTNTLPENATWDSSNSEGIVNQIWNSSSNQYEPSADSCTWSCNLDAHINNNSCDLNQIQTNCTNQLPKYATWNTLNTNGWIVQNWNLNTNQYEPSSDSCVWDCNLEQTKLSQDGTACECDSTLGYFENSKTVCGETQNIISCNNLIDTYTTSSNQSSPQLNSEVTFEGVNGRDANRDFLKGYICWDITSDFLNENCQNIIFDANSQQYEAILSIETAGNYSYRFKFSGDGEESFTECLPLGVATIQSPAEGELFISEYIEGASLNKAIEIYNPTSQSINLEGYELWMGVNGKPFTDASSKKILLNTVLTRDPLPAGETLVIANNGADPLIKEKANLLTPDSTGFCTWSGDDAIALVKNGVIIDVIGIEEQGNNWAVAGVAAATKDHILVRKPGKDFGNTNWEESAGTTLENSEWNIFVPSGDVPVSGFLGTHQN